MKMDFPLSLCHVVLFLGFTKQFSDCTDRDEFSFFYRFLSSNSLLLAKNGFVVVLQHQNTRATYVFSRAPVYLPTGVEHFGMCCFNLDSFREMWMRDVHTQCLIDHNYGPARQYGSSRVRLVPALVPGKTSALIELIWQHPLNQFLVSVDLDGISVCGVYFLERLDVNNLSRLREAVQSEGDTPNRLNIVKN